MKAILGGVIAGIIAIVVLAVILMPVSNNDTKLNEQSHSGPFIINKQEYLLGENIFLKVTALQPDEKGQIHFILPSGDIYRSIPFDGSKSADFNQYFTPFPTASLKVCTSDDLVGLWNVKFQGVHYNAIEFEIISEYIEGEEWKYVEGCGD